ncbi:DUF378 domain-containing protein [Candidatus Daviesbacteria bacterium]|nr:DUF378 domain-containing protein [Candidatus Daviesbacteria bacterium]
MATVDQVANLLVVVGALNWGLVGLLNLNLVSSLLGAGSTLEKVVYVLVGAAGLWVLWKWFGGKK